MERTAELLIQGKSATGTLKKRMGPENSFPKIPKGILEYDQAKAGEHSKPVVYQNFILELCEKKDENARKEFVKKISKLAEFEKIEFAAILEKNLRKLNNEEKIILIQSLVKVKTFAFVPAIADMCNDKNSEVKKTARQYLVKISKSKIAFKNCSEFMIKFLKKELEEKMKKSAFLEKSAILKFAINSGKKELLSIIIYSLASKSKMERECALKHALNNFENFDYLQKSEITKTLKNEIEKGNKNVEIAFAKKINSLPLQSFENEIIYILKNGNREARKICTNAVIEKVCNLQKLEFSDKITVQKIVKEFGFARKIAVHSSMAFNKITEKIGDTRDKLRIENSRARIGLDLALLSAFGVTVFAQSLNNDFEKIPKSEKAKVEVQKQAEKKITEPPTKTQNFNLDGKIILTEKILQKYEFGTQNEGVGGSYDYKAINAFEETANSNGVARLSAFQIKKLEKENLLNLDSKLEEAIFQKLGNREAFKKALLKQYVIDFSKQQIGSTEINLNNEKVFIELSAKGFLIKTKSGNFISSMSNLHSEELLKSLNVPNKNLSLQQFRFEDDIQAEKWAENNYKKLLDFYKNRIEINSYNFNDNKGEICLISTKANMGDDILYSFLLVSEKGVVSSQTVSYKEITGERDTENYKFYEPMDFGIKTMLTSSEGKLELSIMPYRTRHLGLVKKITIPMQSEKI